MADSVIHTKYDPTAPALPPQGQLDNFPVLRECAASYLSPAEVEKIERAYEFARAHHRDQKRKSGEPYINHPVEVAIILAKNLHSDVDMLCAGLLHDTVEDTDATLDELSELFGPQVSELVDGVTKLTNISVSSLSEQQALNLRKMFLAMAKDIRVIIIKLADRLHNMRTLMAIPEDRRIFKANETMSIYAPLANRLGISSIKWELEDLSFFYLDPAKYRQVARMVAESRAEREAYLETVKTILRDELTKAKIEHFRIMGRPKHLYSIYMKMKNKGKDFSEIYDLIALRVITDDVRECYGVLGAVHALWTPMPGRFKDYIAMPKFNMYQSLHTTVIGSQGIPFEVQIRTWEMHQTAEYGVAAHWKYKQHVEGGTEKEFEWVRRLLENQQDTDADDYIHSLKVDMFDDEVFVFTPKGKVMSLPAGSTPIDFAYAIHSAVGNSMIGAKVNNRIAGFDVPLHNGDIVEILTSKTAKGPSRDWLNICKSNQARIKIKQWFKREKREENIIRGKASFESELRHIGIDPALVSDEELLPTLLKKVSFASLDDLYATIGFGGMTALKAVGRIKDELTKASRAQTAKEQPLQIKPPAAGTPNTSGVVVEDIGSCMVKFSRCCAPVPGDDIIGFITKGYGVSVHRRDCPNARGADDPAQAGRWVRVTWVQSPDATFMTSLELEGTDRDGLMLDIATVLTGLRVRISEMNARNVPGGQCLIAMTFAVHSLTELESICARLRGISGVRQIRRGIN